MDSIDTCSLCFEEYEEELRPRMLPCGHTYCSNCIGKLINIGSPVCPTCKTSVSASDPSQIPINFSLEMCISAMKEKFGSIPKSPPPDKTKTLKDMIDSQKCNAHDLLLSSESFNSDVLSYQKYLENNIQKNKDLVRKLHRRAAWHEDIIKLMLKEQEKAKEAQTQAALLSQILQASLPELDCKTDNKAVASASAKVVENFGDLASCLSRNQKELPDFRISISEKALRESEELLGEDDVDDNSLVTTKTFGPSVFLSNPMTIMEKLSIYHKSFMTVKVNDLQSKPNTWRRRINAGKVFAVSSTDDYKRSAALSLRNGKVYLHCLQEQEVPPYSYVIEHEELMNNAEEDSATVFFGWAIDGSPKGQIHIKMRNKSPLAKHFMALCSGELGPTYINKKISMASYYVECEPYNRNDMMNCADPLSEMDLGDAIYTCISEKGTTWVETDGSFRINFSKIGKSYYRVFGKAQDGIDAVVEVLKNDPNSNITVIDTGIVLET